MQVGKTDLEKARNKLFKLDGEFYSHLAVGFNTYEADVGNDNKPKNISKVDERLHNHLNQYADQRIGLANEIIRAKIKEVMGQNKKHVDRKSKSKAKSVAVVRIGQTITVIETAVMFVGEAIKRLPVKVQDFFKQLTRTLAERLVGENILEQRRILALKRIDEDTSESKLIRETGYGWLLDNQTLLNYIDRDDETRKLLKPLHQRKPNMVRDLKLKAPIK